MVYITQTEPAKDDTQELLGNDELAENMTMI